jgi:hypothetical protein
VFVQPVKVGLLPLEHLEPAPFALLQNWPAVQESPLQ